MNSQARLSLNYVFSGSLLCLTMIFIAVMGLAFTRLFQMSQQFEQVSNKAIPDILLYERISSEAQGLRLYTDKLASATTPPAIQVASEGVTNHLDIIEYLLKKAEFDDFIYLQFDAMQNELIELSTMVSDRLELTYRVAALHDTFYQEFDIDRSLQASQIELEALDRSPWGVGQSRLFALTTVLLSTSRLYELRNINGRMRSLMSELENDLFTALPESLRAKARSQNQEMRDLLMSPTGIVEMRYKQLKVEGRTTGRANFTSNLVGNFASTLKFQATELNNRILAQSIATTRRTDEQIFIIGVSTGLALVLLLAIAYILRRTVLLRLIKLFALVTQQSKHGVSSVNIGGNDEISDIAKAVEHYTQTIKKQTYELSMLALSDGLTGIANRRAFDDELTRQTRLSKRYQKPLSLALIDVDYFKPYNDNYGHAKGDDTLKLVAKILKQTIHRNTDFVARYGGEEFAVILPDTTSAGAMRIAQELLEAVAAANIEHKFSSVADYLTVSVGMVTCKPHNSEFDAATLLEYSDQALYKAKQQGRNCFNLITID